ncbi:hypothetical protein KKA02_00765, partial [Patescibacteria group bacterium]|nr:hypothetical protein [Patescibacteria group bacterium]
DSRRKKDLARIRIAFENYYADKGCYPVQAEIDELMDDENCFGDVFSPWLGKWLCDPKGHVYEIAVNNEDDPGCPNWFKIMANLENRIDVDIPTGWYEGGSRYFGDGSLNNNDVNYGISSTNVLWYDEVSLGLGECRGDTCYVLIGTDCQPAWGNHCSGDNCYYEHGGSCIPMCQVSCCREDCE